MPARCPVAPGSLEASGPELLNSWRLVAESRALQARARELAEQMEADIATALDDRGVREAAVCAALIAVAYRAINLAPIRRMLAGEQMVKVQHERADQLNRAFAAVESACELLQGGKERMHR
jgi:hypothetical protein